MQFKRMTPMMLSVLAVAGLGCAGVTPAHSNLPDSSATKPTAAIVDDHKPLVAAGANVERLKAANTAAGSPTIAFVGGYYRLPIANPLGGARIISGNVAGWPINQSLVVPSTYRPYAITPLEGLEAQQMAYVVTDLAVAGVRLVQLSVADATRIMDGEKLAVDTARPMQWNQMVPAGADILVSFHEATGLGGPIYVARMVRMKDGALLAMRTTAAQAGAISLRPLLSTLIADGLEASARLAAQAPTPTR